MPVKGRGACGKAGTCISVARSAQVSRREDRACSVASWRQARQRRSRMRWRWHSPSLRAADVELLAREAGAVDCGLENLLVCLFLGITARGRAPVLVVPPRYNRCDSEQQAWSSSLAASRDKSGESEPESRLGECSECNGVHTTCTGGGRGGEGEELVDPDPVLREQQTRRGCRTTTGPQTGTGRAGLSQIPGVC